MARASPTERRTAPASARLFVALDLPQATRGELARWRDAVVAGGDEWRPAREETLHLTLVFLGWREQELTGRVWALVTAAADECPAPTLTPTRLVARPPRRPRLLALELDDHEGRAAALQRAVSDALEGAGLYRPEQRPFWPHVTVARVRGRARVRTPADPPSPPEQPFSARTVTLYRSVLHPSGARYEPLERLELADGSG